MCSLSFDISEVWLIKYLDFILQFYLMPYMYIEETAIYYF